MNGVTNPDLSARQSRILNFIIRYIEGNSVPPTVKEIQVGTETSSTSVVDYALGQLQTKGRLYRRPGMSRGILLSRNTATFVFTGEEAESLREVYGDDPKTAILEHVEWVLDARKTSPEFNERCRLT